MRVRTLALALALAPAPALALAPTLIAAAYLPAYLVTLWLSAALWTEKVETPFAVALKELLATEPPKPPPAHGEAKGSVATPPATPPATPGGSRPLLQTSLRVGVALLVGVGHQPEPEPEPYP